MLRSLAAPLAWSAFIAIPAAGWGWLDGVPLDGREAAALALVWWTWAAIRHLPAAGLVAGLAALKIAIGALLIDRGFEARYYPNDAWTPPAARSTEFRSRSFTRRDDRLSFGGEDAPDLPLHFFNDLRFNFYQPDQPQRDRLAYSAEWIGYLWTETGAADTTLYLAVGSGIWSALAIDGSDVLALDEAPVRSRAVALEHGWHAITVRVRAPYGASRRVEAGEMRGDARHPFEGTHVVGRPVERVRLAVDTTLRWGSRLVDALVLGWLAVLVFVRAREWWREGRLVPLLALAALAEAFWFARRYAGRLVVLSGGNDWLTYESYARAIALGDVLRGGQDGPFYYQPLYPYFVALSHLAFGDGLFGVVLLQRVLLVATIGWAAALTRRLFGARAGWMAALGGGAFLYAVGGRWTDVVLAEPLFTALLTGWTALLITLAAQPSIARAAVAGAVGGIATLTRSTLLLGWPPMLLAWWPSRPARRSRVLAVLLAAMLAVVGLATIRNWLVARQVVLVTTSFSVNFYVGNQPTRPLAPAPAERLQLYDRLGLDPYVRTVAEFAIQAPGDFARGLGNKALYAVGFFAWSGLPGGVGTSWLYVAVWLLATAGVGRILRTARPPWGSEVWIPAAAALSHLVAVVLVFPHGYRDRLILPLYPLLIPYAAYAVQPVAPAARRGAAGLRFGLETAATWARVHVVPTVASVLRQPRSWLYLLYAVASSQSPDPLAALLLPATALLVGGGTRRRDVHRIAAGALWAFALGPVVIAGSQAATAPHDPLFWAVMTVIALGVSAGAGRWPALAAAAAATAGGCTTVAVVLPYVPDFETSFPTVDAATLRQSVTALVESLGWPVALCLPAVWLQTIMAGAPRGIRNGRPAAAAWGALLAGLWLSLAGAVPGVRINTRLWLVALGALVGLVEARARTARGNGPGLLS